jgi:protein gp37
VSEGCRNCYAERDAYRFGQKPGSPFEGLTVLKNGHASWTGAIQFVEKHLLDPLKWKSVIDGCRGFERRGVLHDPKIVCADCVRRPKRIFVNSMSDLFHEHVTDEMRDRIFAVMALAHQHTFQVLTKRPERMRDYISRREESGPAWRRHAVWMAMSAFDAGLGMPEPQWPLPNVWLGVSDEGNQHQRIDVLRETPAAKRFISAEPLLFDPGTVDLTGIDWVICGGESGPHARPMHPDWARSLRDQCQAAGVPFFFKQWGEWAPANRAPNEMGWGNGFAIVTRYHGDIRGYESLTDETTWMMRKVGKDASGSLLDCLEHKAFPEARG